MYSHAFHLAVLMVETGLLYMLHVLDKNMHTNSRREEKKKFKKDINYHHAQGFN